jgi:hypothetical protein
VRVFPGIVLRVIEHFGPVFGAAEAVIMPVRGLCRSRQDRENVIHCSFFADGYLS